MKVVKISKLDGTEYFCEMLDSIPAQRLVENGTLQAEYVEMTEEEYCQIGVTSDSAAFFA